MTQVGLFTKMLQLHMAEFHEQGYTILPRIIDNTVLAGVRSDLSRWVDTQAQSLIAQGLISDPLIDAPFETRLARLYAQHKDKAPLSLREELHTPGMFGLFFCPAVLDLVEMILGPELRLYPNYTVRPKLPDHAPTEVLWHQDGGYTKYSMGDGSSAVDGLRMVNVWSPLVPARKHNGCMQFIPGTHKLGVVPHTKKKHYLEIDAEYIQPRLDQTVDVICDPGDVVLFSNLLFHMGQPNRSDAIRWSCDWRYQDATQPTGRQEHGHLARSTASPERAISFPEQWSRLTFS
ncbi:MAG: phytanoyl-CoA dioxygenase family protein [Phycisphaeraceae bacterium]